MNNISGLSPTSAQAGLQKADIKNIKQLSFEEVIALIDAGDISEPISIRLYLDTATTLKALSVSGNFLGVIAASSQNAAVSVNFNKTSTDTVEFTRGLYMIRPYKQIFLSWEAQANEYIDLMISAYAPELFNIQDFRSQVSQAADIAEIRLNTRSLNGDTVTQVIKSGAAANTTTVIHTVTAGKSLYLTGFNAYGEPTAYGTLIVTNSADVTQYTLAVVYCPAAAGDGIATSLAMPNPIVIPAGYKIKIVGVGAGANATAFIKGWEE